MSAIAGCNSDQSTSETASTSVDGSPTATENPTATESPTPIDSPTATENPTATPRDTPTPGSGTSPTTDDRHPAAQVAYEFYVAFIEGKVDAANDLVHPNHPGDQGLPVTEEAASDTAGVNIIGAQIVERDGEFAYIEVRIDDNGSTFDNVITLRTHEGEWMIWSPLDYR